MKQQFHHKPNQNLSALVILIIPFSSYCPENLWKQMIRFCCF